MPVTAASKIKAAPRWVRPSAFADPEQIVHTRNVGLLLYAKAYLWFHRIADFRQGEMALMYRRKPGNKVRSQHRQILQMLVEEGNQLVRQVDANGGFIKAENGFTLADIQSAIDDLRNTLLQWYGGMPRSRKDAILNAIFDASK